ncbi:hypothetical protein GCM10010211_74800 [Streptomyces albospinus]|uniref:Uncharacterized protein n=1 Tax=Streptomyces albospinus TaxID=285515 RepID=A0ABQ2VM84_9ACTN|nr:hypothetical protein GCM10010211_74800 [Streptomyces albospinus]
MPVTAVSPLAVVQAVAVEAALDGTEPVMAARLLKAFGSSLADLGSASRWAESSLTESRARGSTGMPEVGRQTLAVGVGQTVST